MDRRVFLQSVGAAGAWGVAASMTPSSADAQRQIVHEVDEGGALAGLPAGQSIRFAVCGMSHDHIYGMVNAIVRGGGVLVSAYGAEPDKAAAFQKRYPDAKMVSSEREIIDDPAIQLVLSSTIPNQRAALGVEVMRHGKDFLSDKPGMTTLEQLAEVRRTIAETKRLYAIMYSEMLEVPAAVKAAELVHSGAIGRVIQTINIAPHQIVQRAGDAGGAAPRPNWFWNPEQYGGILCDIGSHQVYQYLYFTGSRHAEIAESQVANVAHPEHPRFQDFGDMVLRGDRGFGYVRLDWFTPNGLGTWGDGRLFILGTEGYIEVRKYTNVAVSQTPNHLYIVDARQARYIDCNKVPLPFGPQFVSDVIHRTHTAQDQEQALYAAELVIKAQRDAKVVQLS